MGTFSDKINQLRIDVINELEKLVSKEKVVFVSNTTINELDESFLELTRACHYGKYNSYEEYAIIAISRNEENKIVLHGYSIDGETREIEKDFETDNLTTAELCGIVDEIIQMTELEKAIPSFLDQFATKASKDEDTATTELMMDDHKCIHYQGQDYYIPENNSFYTHREELIIDLLNRKYPVEYKTEE